MFKYGIYTRKSDDDRSVTEKSIGEQMAECKKLTLHHDLVATREWEESKSAKYPSRRPQYSEMISLVKKGEIQGIVCWHINRLVRNMEEGGTLAQLLIDGVLKEIRTPSAVYRTGDNIMPLVIEAASATQYSLDHAKAVSRGKEGSFRAGGCTNKAPQGYRNARDLLNLKKGVIEIDPERFETVKRAWRLMLTGTSTLRRVVDTMNETWGFRTRPTKKQGNTKLSYTGAYLMFRNPFYAGFVRLKGELVKGNHEPMITAAEFEQVQRIISRNSFSAPRVKAYAFTGLMRCAHCGKQITAETKTLRNGSLWENYHCSDAHLKCTKLGMSRSKVEARIVEELDSLHIDPDFLAAAEGNLRRNLQCDLDGVEKLLNTQVETIAQVDARLEKLYDMWMGGLITDETTFKRLEEKELDAKSKLRIETAKVQGRLTTMRSNLDGAFKFLRKAQEEFQIPDERRKKELASAMASSYVFDGKTKAIHIQIHPILVGLVSYARKISGLEPQESGSEIQKEQAFMKPVLFGGDKRSSLEPPEELIQTLESTSFPNLWTDS